MPETLRDKAEIAFSDGNPQKALHFASRHIDLRLALLGTKALTMEEFKAELDWYLKLIERMPEAYPEEHLSSVLAEEIEGTIESLKLLDEALSELERTSE